MTAPTEIANGFPVKIVVPCEGTGYEVGSMSLVKGARNLDNAQKFYDWALTPAAQKIGAGTQELPDLANRDADPARRAGWTTQADQLRLRQIRDARSASACSRSGSATCTRNRDDARDVAARDLRMEAECPLNAMPSRNPSPGSPVALATSTGAIASG